MIDWNRRAMRSAPPPCPAMITISTGFCGAQSLAAAVIADPINMAEADVARTNRRVRFVFMNILPMERCAFACVFGRLRNRFKLGLASRNFITILAVKEYFCMPNQRKAMRACKRYVDESLPSIVLSICLYSIIFRKIYSNIVMFGFN